MAFLTRSQRLNKEVGLLGAYAIATGATVSSGFFLLPGLAAAEVGPSLVLSYLVAALPLLPAAFCMVELSTAMPRAGGAYFFLDRSMGPLVGTIGGIGTWLVLVLKTCFALVGMGAYLHLLEPRLPIMPVAISLALLFGALNLVGSRSTATTQIVLVAGLLSIISWFLFRGTQELETSHFAGMFELELDSLLSSAGLVYISYVGVTKVASMSEEIRNPERNLPIAVFASLITAVVVYGLGTFVMVGVIPPERLAGDLTPPSTAAGILAGSWGRNLMAVAALLAFSSVANVGIFSASRYPLAMSRDHLLPSQIRRLSRRRIPYVSVCMTVAVVLVLLIALDPVKIAKLAGAFQLIVFALICLAVIVMRESKIQSYDPSFRSPLYPYLQIAGVVLPLVFVADMGWLPIVFCAALLVGSTAWYFHFARNRVSRGGAISHVFYNLGEKRYRGLDSELRTILKEKGLRADDPYDTVVAHAAIIEAPEGSTFEEATRLASNHLSELIDEQPSTIAKEFFDGTSFGATPTANGAALPHFRHKNVQQPLLCIVRSKDGIVVDPDDPLWSGHAPSHPIYAIFYLVSNEKQPAAHLRILAHLAERIEDDGFLESWRAATDELNLKELLLVHRHFLGLTLVPESPAAVLIGRSLSEIDIDGCLVASVLRNGRTVVPHGSTVLREMDRIGILGQAVDIDHLRSRFLPQTTAHNLSEVERATPRPTVQSRRPPEYERILCCFNVDVDSTDVLRLAADLAGKSAASVTVLDVQKELPWYSRLVDGAQEDGVASLVEKRAIALQRRIEDLASDGLPIETRVDHGVPFVEIIRHAVRHQHDLVIKGGEQSRLRAAFFGSTAAHLVRKCPCPVWLAVPGFHLPLSTVAAAISPDPESASSYELNLRIIEHARMVAELYDAELILLHVWNEGIYRYGRSEVGPKKYTEFLSWLQTEVESSLMRFLAEVGLSDLEDRLRLVRGEPVSSIPELVRQNGVSLLVLGSVSRARMAGMFIGNVAEEMLREAPCSLLTIKPDGFVTPLR